MPAPTVEVTVKLSDILGAAIEGATVKAKLDRYEVYQQFVVADDTTGTTDANGECVLDLFPNALPTNDPAGLGSQGSVYIFTITGTGGKTVKVQAVIPNQACDLHDVITAEEPGDPSTGEIVGAVRYNIAQSLDGGQQTQARENIGFLAAVRATVLTGLSTATNAVIAATDTVLEAFGKLQAQVTANLATLTGHTGNTSNPHSVTAAQAGADPTGTAAAAVSAHEVAGDPHPQYTSAAEASAAAPVQSVAGRTGAVILTSADAVQPTEYTDEQPTSVFAVLRARAHVKRFWVSGDGSDWGAAFARASASGARNIKVHGDEVLSLSTGANILSDQDWEFDGASITLTDNTQTIFTATSASRWSVRGRVQLTGSRAGSGSAAETGLAIVNGKRYLVEGLTATNFKGAGISLSGSTSGSLRGDRGQFNAVAAHESSTGILIAAGAGSEYNVWTNVAASGNAIGIDSAAGNNFFSGGVVVDNDTGVKLQAGANHCHGGFSGVAFNHNTTYNVHAVAVTNGHRFDGCAFYGSGSSSGALFFDECSGIVLDGGYLDAWVYNYEGASSGFNYIKNMYCPGSYGDVKRLYVSPGVPTELIVQGCSGPGAYDSGVSINDPAPVYVAVIRDPGSTQAVSGSTVLKFPSIAANGDRRAAYDTSTGIFTVPAGMGGQYRIVANLFFTGASIVADASYVDLLINGASPSLILLTPYGTSLLTACIARDVYLNPADEVTFAATIAGTSPTFGGSPWSATMSIERIA